MAKFSLGMSLYPQIKLEATPSMLCGTLTLAALWCHLLHNRKVSVSNLVFRDGMMVLLAIAGSTQ